MLFQLDLKVGYFICCLDLKQSSLFTCKKYLNSITQDLLLDIHTCRRMLCIQFMDTFDRTVRSCLQLLVLFFYIFNDNIWFDDINLIVIYYQISIDHRNIPNMYCLVCWCILLYMKQQNLFQKGRQTKLVQLFFSYDKVKINNKDIKVTTQLINQKLTKRYII